MPRDDARYNDHASVWPDDDEVGVVLTTPGAQVVLVGRGELLELVGGRTPPATMSAT